MYNYVNYLHNASLKDLQITAEVLVNPVTQYQHTEPSEVAIRSGIWDNLAWTRFYQSDPDHSFLSMCFKKYAFDDDKLGQDSVHLTARYGSWFGSFWN